MLYIWYIICSIATKSILHNYVYFLFINVETLKRFLTLLI